LRAVLNIDIGLRYDAINLYLGPWKRVGDDDETKKIQNMKVWV